MTTDSSRTPATVLPRVLGGCLIATSATISVALLADHPRAMVLALLAHAAVLIAVGSANLQPPAATDEDLLVMATITGRHAATDDTDDTPTAAIRVVPAEVAR